MIRILLLSSLLSLCACGFSPVYGNGAQYSSVSVDDIPGRSGHELRKALLVELAAGLPNVDSANLNIDLDEELQRIPLRPDAAAARTDIKAIGRYVLIFDDTTISGSVESHTSFNVPDAPYGDIAAQTDASKRAMRKLASAIVDDLRLKLAAAQ